VRPLNQAHPITYFANVMGRKFCIIQPKVFGNAVKFRQRDPDEAGSARTTFSTLGALELQTVFIPIHRALNRLQEKKRRDAKTQRWLKDRRSGLLPVRPPCGRSTWKNFQK